MLTDLAHRGSGLAMMYLGHSLVETDRADIYGGEAWLVRSAQAGSIAGQYQLALYYQRQDRFEEARSNLMALAQKGYSPAAYTLAVLHYRGLFGKKSVSEAIRYFECAKNLGHFLAAGRLALTYRIERCGFRLWAVAQWHCLRNLPNCLWYMYRYPNSDRLKMPSWR